MENLSYFMHSTNNFSSAVVHQNITLAYILPNVVKSDNWCVKEKRKLRQLIIADLLQHDVKPPSEVERMANRFAWFLPLHLFATLRCLTAIFCFLKN
jgi:hypothetical protein